MRLRTSTRAWGIPGFNFTRVGHMSCLQLGPFIRWRIGNHVTWGIK